MKRKSHAIAATHDHPLFKRWMNGRAVSSKRSIVIAVVISFVVLNACRVTFFQTASSAPLEQLNSQLIETWWPLDNGVMAGTQPFKARLSDHRDLSSYVMYWQVDGGQMTRMDDSQADAPHKESYVNVGNWTWHGRGPYVVTFVASQPNGNVIAKSSIQIFNDSAVGTSQFAPSNVGSSSSSSSVSSSIPSSSSSSISAVLSSTPSSQSSALSAAAPAVTVWNPVDGAVIHGTVAFRATVQGMNLNDYKLFWFVDTGSWNQLDNSTVDYPHKETAVYVDNWTWKGSGPYAVTFVAQDLSGHTIGQTRVFVTIGTQSTQPSSAASKPSPSSPVAIGSLSSSSSSSVSAVSSSSSSSAAPVQKTTPLVQAGNPLSGSAFYIDPYSNARNQINAWRTSRPDDAQQLEKIASKPLAIWVGNWNSDVRSYVNDQVSKQTAAGDAPVMVVYNIPQRDCGGYSAGGTDDYRNWIRSVADGIAGRKTAVILEPDSLSLISCLNESQLADRYSLLKDAVNVLKSKGAVVYIDAGHPDWISASDMASRLKQAGIDQADGFALNVSNFYTTQQNIDYGKAISSAVSGKHFIVDVSRNGNGSNGEWCNPWGRAMGPAPTTDTGNPLADAFIYAKDPGGSDGNCNGGPSAGSWWADYALDIAKNSH